MCLEHDFIFPHEKVMIFYFYFFCLKVKSITGNMNFCVFLRKYRNWNYVAKVLGVWLSIIKLKNVSEPNKMLYENSELIKSITNFKLWHLITWYVFQNILAHLLNWASFVGIGCNENKNNKCRLTLPSERLLRIARIR